MTVQILYVKFVHVDARKN